MLNCLQTFVSFISYMNNTQAFKVKIRAVASLIIGGGGGGGGADIHIFVFCTINFF